MQRLSLITAFLAVLMTVSCSVDNDYILGHSPKDQIDLNLTLFQSGREIPIGSTDSMTLESLIEQSGYTGDFLYVTPEGNYAAKYEDGFDITQWFDVSRYPLYEGDIPGGLPEIPDVTDTYDFLAETLFFDDVPDMFLGDDVCLDLVGSSLKLNFTGNVIFDSKASVEFVSFREGKKDVSVTMDGIKLPNAELGNNLSYERNGQDLDEIFKYIPDSLQIIVHAAVTYNINKPVHISPKDFSLALSYKLDLPMSVGPEFSLTLDQDIDTGFNIGSIFKLGPLGIKGTFENALAFGIDLKLDFVDNMGNIVPLSGSDLSAELAPGNGASSPTVPSEIRLLIDPQTGNQIDNISAIRLNLGLRSTPKGGTLTPKDYLKLSNLSLVVPEGLNINLEEL